MVCFGAPGSHCLHKLLSDFLVFQLGAMPRRRRSGIKIKVFREDFNRTNTNHQVFASAASESLTKPK